MHAPESLSPFAHAVSASLAARGLSEHGFIGAAELGAATSRVDASVAAAYGLVQARGAVIAALPYRAGPDDAAGAGGPAPYARVAPFASANRYATLVRLLKEAAESAGLPRHAFRIFVNSRLPEKPLAVLAGLGFIGRSSLLVEREWGTSCLLGGMLLPEDPFGGRGGRPPEPGALEPGVGCGSCRACADACPTGAIAAPGSGRAGLDRLACIQHWTTEPDPVPARVTAAWGDTLYGCDACVRACPFSAGVRDAPDPVSPAEAKPGSLLSIPWLTAASDGELRERFRGTALGMKRFSPGLWRRNARLAGK